MKVLKYNRKWSWLEAMWVVTLSIVKYEIVGQWHAGCCICNKLSHGGHNTVYSPNVWALMINRVWHYFVFLCIGACYDSWASMKKWISTFDITDALHFLFQISAAVQILGNYFRGLQYYKTKHNLQCSHYHHHHHPETASAVGGFYACTYACFTAL